MPSERINQLRWCLSRGHRWRFKLRQQSGWHKVPLTQATEKADSAKGERQKVDPEKSTARSMAMKFGWASLTEAEKKRPFKEPPDSLTCDLGACAFHERPFFEKWATAQIDSRKVLSGLLGH